MEVVKLHKKEFVPFLSSELIQNAIEAIADQINKDFAGKEVIILGVLDGAFMMVSDLMKRLKVNAELTFVKLKSYHGDRSSGSVNEVLPLTEVIRKKHVIVVEDIIDTGLTLAFLRERIMQFNPSSLSIATLLLKPEVFQDKYPVEYIGIEIANKFVVGYGMDYDGLGRQLPDIYVAKE